MNKEYFNNNYFRQQSIGPNDNIKVPEAYIETNMFLNVGKHGVFHMSFPDSQIERDKVFEGEIVEAVKDHFVVHSTSDNAWYLLPYLYLNYVKFNDKPILYS